jgi:hypothetical protein
MACQARGLDWTALTSEGLLAGLSDGELVALARAVADRIDAVLLLPMDDEPIPALSEAAAALRLALG